MRKFLYSLCLIYFGGFQNLKAQDQGIHGQVVGSQSVENIHVINSTSKVFTITNSKGEFKISARLNDTLVFSSVQYKKLNLVVTARLFNEKPTLVFLEDAINELEEVVIGKILSGNLEEDISVFDVKRDINFYDVGIPGYTGKKKTQTERLLNEATTGSYGSKLRWYSPLTGNIPINPIINGISGRTKMLKYRLKLEEKDELLHKIRSKLSEDFFSSYPLYDNLKKEFFYFCSEDLEFVNRCKDKTDLEVYIFLQEKYVEYLANLNELKD